MQPLNPNIIAIACLVIFAGGCVHKAPDDQRNQDADAYFAQSLCISVADRNRRMKRHHGPKMIPRSRSGATSRALSSCTGSETGQLLSNKRSRVE